MYEYGLVGQQVKAKLKEIEELNVKMQSIPQLGVDTSLQGVLSVKLIIHMADS